VLIDGAPAAILRPAALASTIEGMESSAFILDAGELAALDAGYEPFPAFDDWARANAPSQRWDEVLNELERAAEAATPADLDRAVGIAVRAAAVETGAIEGLYSTDRGFTLTVATQAAAWQEAMAARGSNVRPLFEAQLAAYELTLDAATRRLPVTEAWIRRLHEELCRPQDTYQVVTAVGMQDQPLEKGRYKRHPNHVRLPNGTVHAYAPVTEVGAEMHRLVAELGTAGFERSHPALQASYAHYALAAIHPFADGNGRVARALASTYLYRAARVPLLVFADRRTPYFDALQRADEGDRAVFVRLVRDSALAAMALVAETLRAAQAPKPEDALARLRSMLTAQGELTHTELNHLGAAVYHATEDAFRRRIEALALPPGIKAEPGSHGGNIAIPEQRSFRPYEPRALTLTATSAAPVAVTERACFYVYVSRTQDEARTILLFSPELDLTVTLALADVHPSLGATALQRLQTLSDRALGLLFARLEAAVAESLDS
jgi:Fic family protein